MSHQLVSKCHVRVRLSTYTEEVFSRAFQIALYAVDGIGSALHRRCLAALESRQLDEAAFWRNSGEIWQKIGLNKKIIESIKKFKKEYTLSSYQELLSSKDIRVIFPGDQEFPPLLAELENHPPLLFVRGGELAPDMSPIAVVGSRRMTEYGRRVVTELVPSLVQAGKTIVSGFMYGVDVTAQQAALRVGGSTVGVLGFGFDHLYPPEQRGLFEEFLAAGAVFLSPFAPHVPARPGNFPARNAIVAGMSEGVLVVEAAAQSGSLITAGYAADLGREVWVVSGSMFSEFSAGTKELVNQGAQLITEASDILGGTSRTPTSAVRRRYWHSLPDHQRQICEVLEQEALPLETLSEVLSMEVKELSTNLVQLELIGVVEQSGNQWRLADALPDGV